ncbi:type I methionyl aminopeptidase [Microlunatus panaciterrae]|nr:type I methionyl aminopeptidase [Microlunatus panaciterrae]
MFWTPRGVELKKPHQLQQMRKAGLVVARALEATTAAARPGVSTAELDAVAADVIAAAGATPSFLGYHGFPGVTCISVNEEVVHGIPGERVLVEGDLVSIDCGAIVDGWHGDSARTVFVGEASPEAQALSEATRMALWQGMAAAALGGHVTDISAAVEDYVRSLDNRYGIVEEYVGHGIGSAMHQPPDVPNFGRAGRGPRIVEGLALAVEPMLTLGEPDNRVLADDWTVVTADGSLACHWEHTMTVTRNGIWVLTAEDGGEELLSQLGVAFGPLAD